MVTYTPINLTSARSEFSQRFERELKSLPIFRYTQIVNAHVLYNFKSPTSQFGEYDYVLFIDIPYVKINNKQNCCKCNNVFVNSLAIAVRSIYEADVINADDKYLFTESGSWDYMEQIEEERMSLRNFVLDNVPDIKYFDLAIIYNVTAPKSNKVFYHENLAFNQDLALANIVTYSIDLLNNGRNVNALLLTNGNKSAVWEIFINKFIEASDKKTQQGILTKKKVDTITRKNTSKRLEQVFNAIGNKLCIISGKAGAGKTMALLRIAYNQVRKDESAPSHHCRLLTYNNMLVMDLKQTIKCIGDFMPNNLSISTLHKFFYEIYKDSPVRVLHMDKRKINELFNLCISRVAKYNFLLKMAHLKFSTYELNIIVKEVEEMRVIKIEDYKEIKQYKDFLFRKKQFDLAELDRYLKEYVNFKREVFEREYLRNEFFNGYNIIIEQLYLIYHNLEEFEEKYNLATKYAKEELNSSVFKTRYEDLYDRFMVHAEMILQNDIKSTDDLISNFTLELERLEEINDNEIKIDPENTNKRIKEHLIRIKRKVNWSKFILIDEAQDCQIYEKALLLELNGSDNTIVATGGHDQLIRTPKENNWSVCLGHPLVTEKITLSNVSYRQKGNIVKFLNAFSNEFNIKTQLSSIEETNNYGRVIIDCRQTSIPFDTIKELYLSGKDYGCSNYENLMFLLPKEGYLETESSKGKDVIIDRNNTIVIKESSPIRKMNITLPEELNAIDGTINDKREIINNAGQGNTRCLLYESCRGLEAWNVLCMDLDVFYNEQKNSKEADEYATTNASLFENDKEMFKSQYASLWCYMAMTRAIDTLYIKLSNDFNCFSSSLLSIAKRIPNIEILKEH